MTLTTLKQEDSGDDIRFLEELLSSLLMFGQALEKLKLATTLVDSDVKYDSRTTDVVRAVRRP